MFSYLETVIEVRVAERGRDAGDHQIERLDT